MVEQQLQTAIAALEAQRGVLGDVVVDTALAPLRTKINALQGELNQQLKQVTVLFADIVGSTTLSQHLDPEEVHAIMDGALQQFTARVQTQGGRVLQYAGDSLLAVFGADEAREDDAESAVRAGLSVLDEGRAQGELVRLRHGHDAFNVRVGIHTGPVLLGGGVDAEGSIRGMTVNIAARMEQSAPVGALRVSQATWRHVAGAFEGDAQPRLEVKGSDEPLLTWIVRRARPLTERERARGVEGLRTPLVGRDVELAEIERLLGGAALEQGLQAVTLIADAGLGKTRLLTAWRARLLARAPGTPLLVGRAHPQNRLQPYGLLRDLLARWLHIADDDSAQEARRRLVEGLAPRLREDAEAQAQIVGQLIGLDFGDSPHLRGVDARQMRDRAFRALTVALGRLQGADGSPSCLLLEDLHWADDASLDFVQHLLVRAAAQPLRMLMAARPGLLELRPGWGEGVSGHCLVHLGPLATEHSLALADELLGRVDQPQPALRKLLVTRAEGNPFYMEELVKMLLDQGAIVAEGERWRVHTERLAQLQVPGTLVGVLQARLDTLPAADRRSLQQASIVGPVFWDDALAALDERAPLSLPALRLKALVQSRGTSAFDGTREEMFHHHLLHQVTYDTVLKAARREGHAKAALWLADRVGDRTSEYLAVTAEHYDRAGDQAQAIDYFERAIQEAQRRDAHTVVLAHLDRVLVMPELTDAPAPLQAADMADQQRRPAGPARAAGGVTGRARAPGRGAGRRQPACRDSDQPRSVAGPPGRRQRRLRNGRARARSGRTGRRGARCGIELRRDGLGALHARRTGRRALACSEGLGLGAASHGADDSQLLGCDPRDPAPHDRRRHRVGRARLHGRGRSRRARPGTRALDRRAAAAVPAAEPARQPGAGAG